MLTKTIGRPGSSTGTSVLSSNGLGQQVQQADPFATTSWTYTPWGALATFVNGRSQTFTYAYDDAGRLSDVNGNPAGGYNYDPFGVGLGAYGNQQIPFRFGGHYGAVDLGASFIHMRARMYSTVQLRFLQPDFFNGSPMQGQTLNRYAYVLGNPVMNIDPLGLESLSTLGLLGGILGLLGLLGAAFLTLFNNFAGGAGLLAQLFRPSGYLQMAPAGDGTWVPLNELPEGPPETPPVEDLSASGQPAATSYDAQPNLSQAYLRPGAAPSP